MVSGRGVGMAIIRQKIKKYNGQIRIDFSEGKYCEFIVVIPIN